MKKTYRHVELHIRKNNDDIYVVDHRVDGEHATTYTMYTLRNARDWADTVSNMERQYNKRATVRITEII